MSDDKETKQEVTNERILEHLKEIEMAQGCIANGINALFCIIKGKEEWLKLRSEEAMTIQAGIVALDCITERMIDISGMNEEVQKNILTNI